MHCCGQHSHFDSIFKWLLFMGLKTRLKNVNLKRIQPKDLLNGDHQKRYSHILHFIIQNNYEKYFIFDSKNSFICQVRKGHDIIAVSCMEQNLLLKSFLVSEIFKLNMLRIRLNVKTRKISRTKFLSENLTKTLQILVKRTTDSHLTQKGRYEKLFILLKFF